ncbi:MAG: hypothetical protein ACLQVF_37230 [Isosphaeraceae bacterium]
MAHGKELEPQTGRAVSAQAPQQSPAVTPPVIDAEFSEVKPDVKAPAAATSAAPPQGRKIGQGHLAAMVRLGLKELAQALPAFPDSNIKPVEEPGAIGNVTPPIVTDQMGYDASSWAHRAQFQSKDKEQELGR